MTPAQRTAVGRLASALRDHVASLTRAGNTRCCIDIARNVACAMLLEDDLDVAALIREAIDHRVSHGWAWCEDSEAAARAGADAWKSAFHEGRVAA